MLLAYVPQEETSSIGADINPPTKTILSVLIGIIISDRNHNFCFSYNDLCYLFFKLPSISTRLTVCVFINHVSSILKRYYFFAGLSVFLKSFTCRQKFSDYCVCKVPKNIDPRNYYEQNDHKNFHR